MPLYDYECKICFRRFEAKLSISELDKPNPTCDQCGSQNTVRKLSNIVIYSRSNDKHSMAAGKKGCGSCSTRAPSSCSGCGSR